MFEQRRPTRPGIWEVLVAAVGIGDDSPALGGKDEAATSGGPLEWSAEEGREGQAAVGQLKGNVGNSKHVVPEVSEARAHEQKGLLDYLTQKRFDKDTKPRGNRVCVAGQPALEKPIAQHAQA